LNQLEDLSWDDCSGMESLSTLILSKNNLTELPSLTECLNLRKLYVMGRNNIGLRLDRSLDGNRFKTVPDLASLKSLTELYFVLRLQCDSE